MLDSVAGPRAPWPVAPPEGIECKMDNSRAVDLEGRQNVRTLQDYTIVVRPDDNGTFVAYVPAIQGCHAWAQTQEEARAELAHVFQMIAEEYEEAARPLPADVELTVARAG